MSPLRGERLLKRPIASLSESCSREWAALALNQCAVAMESVAELGLARIMQEIRIRVDWGPEKMP